MLVIFCLMKFHRAYIITLLLVIALISNIRSIQTSKSALQKIDDANYQLEKIKIQNAQLTDQIEYAKSSDYLSTEAFKRFNLVKEDSTVLIIDQKPDDQMQIADSSPISGDNTKQANQQAEKTKASQNFFQKILDWLLNPVKKFLDN